MKAKSSTRSVVLPRSRLRRLLLLYRPARRRTWKARVPFYLVSFLVLPLISIAALGAYVGPDETLEGLLAVAVIAGIAYALRMRAILADGRLRPGEFFDPRGKVLDELPFALQEPPRRRPFKGLLTSIAGYVLLVAGFYGLGRVADRGLRLLQQGRRLRAIDGRSLLRKRPGEPLVLLLRSFEDEEIQDPRPVSLFMRRYEESLSRALGKFGPVITIGRPGDEIAFAGAGRLFVFEADWRPAVRYLMRLAGAVVIIVGRTEGLWWEIREALRLVSPDRLLFFFPYVQPPEEVGADGTRSEFSQRWSLPRRALDRMVEQREERYQVLRERLADLLHCEFPRELGKAVFLDFTRDGRVRLLGPRYPSATRYLLFFSANFLLDLLYRRRVRFDIARTASPFIDKLYETQRSAPARENR